MAPTNREKAITWLNSIGIQELVDDSIMPRESLGPNDNPMTGAEPGASPLLPVERFTDSLLNTLFVLTHLRSDHAAIKQELLEAVHFRRNTKGQPNRRENCLINLDVNRLVNHANNERNQKRLRGELPPRVKKNPGKMERALAKMSLDMGGDGQGEDVSMTEQKAVIGQHNGTIGEKRKRSGSDSNSKSDSSPARPSKLMHMECSDERMDLALSGAEDRDQL
ncbi:uncharacterized protein J3D65DRAFT_150161 [Phyllosticta citribraziliensis]|uniref:Uncharacterized protein n=1 Tax=Phyllosticta citribraziliensis TaxID=989973 RepID=A0ABR1L972_9PEZI